MKLTSALFPAAMVGALLVSGCTASGEETEAAAEDCVAAGEASDSIETTGEIGSDLELTSDTPISSTELERSVIAEGEGEPIAEGESIEAAMTSFNGLTGEALSQSPATVVTLQGDGALYDWAYEAIRCAVPGQEVAMVAPYSELYPDTDPVEDMGLEDFTTDDSIVIVMSFEESDVLARAEGETQEAPDGFPGVELDDDGAPTITIPEGEDPPTEIETATLIQGSGDEVQETDTVTLHYTGVIWGTGEVFDSSWENGSPYTLAANGFIPGFTDAIVGQKVGSQIIAVIPADDGYGAEDLESMGYEADDVMVFVIDLLGTTPAETSDDSASEGESTDEGSAE